MQFLTPQNISVPVDWHKLYNKLRPISKLEDYTFFIYSLRVHSDDHYTMITKVFEGDPDLTAKKLGSCSQLWEKNVHEPINEEERLFKVSQSKKRYNLRNSPKLCEIARIYAYHSYGGYYGFFRPDLMEVIKIAQSVIRDTLDSTVFVSTEPCTSQGNRSDHFPDCYDSQLDMYRAVTILYTVQEK